MPRYHFGLEFMHRSWKLKEAGRVVNEQTCFEGIDLAKMGFAGAYPSLGSEQ